MTATVITTTYWVSPNGVTDAPGTEAAPLAIGALPGIVRDAAMLAPATGSTVTFILMDGTYPLDAPLRFDDAVAGPGRPDFRFVAAPGANPVISGGVRIAGWRLHDPALNIYRAAAPHRNARQLYVNSRRAQRARTTMPDGGNPAAFRPNQHLPQDIGPTVPYHVGGGIDFLPTDLNPARWRDPATQWKHPHLIEAVLETQWRTMRVPLLSITPSDGTVPGRLEMAQPAWTNANLSLNKPAGGNDPDSVNIWSFWQVTRFENAYEFLDQPGEWYLDPEAGEIFYIPLAGEDMDTVEIWLPLADVLVEARGSAERPVLGLSFEGLTFRHAGWVEPDGPDGYVADQSGFRVCGDGHHANYTGHSERVARTPGNLRFAFVRHVRFHRCRFEHLGAVALDFDTGTQLCRVTQCRFEDISSAAIQLGGVDKADHHPDRPGQYTQDNVIADNLVLRTGRDYGDAAAIYIGFSRNTQVTRNTISESAWSGIAIGWGWGLLDPGSFPGIPHARPGMWGVYDTPTANSGNRITHNHISRFLENRWDGGAIYSCGRQAGSFEDALLVEGNVACGKPAAAGGNILYSDGGSRYIIYRGNALFDNPIGQVDLGPPPRPGDPLPYDPSPSKLNAIPYGGDTGGCRTYGDIHYEGNYWMAGLLPWEELAVDVAELIETFFACHGRAFDTYSPQGFFDACPYQSEGVSYPTGLIYDGNHDLPLGQAGVPAAILRGAGVQGGASPYAAAGEAPTGGGASFPPLYSGPSWAVPRVSLPGLMGLQPQYGQEWWYYVGLAHDGSGQAYSLHLQISRAALGGMQLGLGLTGIGWNDLVLGDLFLCGEGVGLDAAQDTPTRAALIVPPVDDYAYSAHFRPAIEVSDRTADPLLNLYENPPFPLGRDCWAFDYQPEPGGGAPLANPGSRYHLHVQGMGVLSAGGGAAMTAQYEIDLTVTDERGMVMEGLSGYVGPAMFASGGSGTPASYECAQPRLRIETGGSLTVEGRTVRLTGGMLWLDRQLVTAPPGGGARPSADNAGLRAHLLGGHAARPLYLGDWIALTLADGHSLAVVEFWQQSDPQWITGTLVGKPPQNGFANLYFPLDGLGPQGNGGLVLKPRRDLGDPDWDYDLNILHPDDPQASPHWTSPTSGKTYATAWRIDFSERVQATGLPPTLYLHAVASNCEIIPGAPSGAFFEGAALVYLDPERTQPFGHAFVEQMGF